MANSARVAVVTGGASGIGRAMARYFVERQYRHVAVLDVDETSGRAVADALQKDAQPGTGVQFLRCDVSSWASQAAAFAAVHGATGRIDVVMANAGISEGGESVFVAEAMGKASEASAPAEPSLRTLNVNLAGAMYSVKLATHYMRKNAEGARRGNIVCTASNAGLYPFPIAPVYAASKAGVIGLVRAMARPLESAGIQIHALAPAVLETNIAPSKDLFANMIMTPMTTLVRGVDEILTGQRVADGNVSGSVAEIHGDSVTFRGPPPYVDADSERNLETFWSTGYA